jgi:RNA polymerase sigma-70 factor (ECF subfamily)
VSAGPNDRAGGDLSDETLAARVKAGDREAFAPLVMRHERRLYNLAFRMLGRAEDARDAVQDAFVSCYRRIETFRGDAMFSTWMHRIVVNACYDILRKRLPEPVDPLSFPDVPSADPADRAVAEADVHRALQAIPAEFRAALVLHDLLDVSVEDVASILDVPVGTVKSRLHRARIHLGRALGVEPSGLPAASKPPIP